MLKKILLVLVALVLVFVVVVALQPSEFHVERSVTVDAPASKVFGEVNDFHKWEAWSPWAKLDPNAKVNFEGPEAG
ncbi:MAG: SRPBCC family protein [Methyloceanibacter sp.]|uniref:SRPBCC family protein n=1 Tax=Methyloceanibacter sp. TaxID=1965321 RepID=UPI003EE2D911